MRTIQQTILERSDQILDFWPQSLKIGFEIVHYFAQSHSQAVPSFKLNDFGKTLDSFYQIPDTQFPEKIYNFHEVLWFFEKDNFFKNL